MSRPFAERFPSVARLLGMAQADADENEEGREPGADGEGEDDDTNQENPEAGDEDGAGEDGGDGGEGGEGGEGPGADALADVRSAELNSVSTDAQLMAAFERDANQLVSAERQRCIDVFTSDAGRRNVAGAALMLGDDDFAQAGAPKIIKLLGTMGSSRGSDRVRLLNAETRPDTGASSDVAASTSDVVKAHRERQKTRNKSVPNGKKVGAAPGATADDS